VAEHLEFPIRVLDLTPPTPSSLPPVCIANCYTNCNAGDLPELADILTTELFSKPCKQCSFAHLRPQNGHWIRDRNHTERRMHNLNLYIVSYLIHKISFTVCVAVDVGCGNNGLECPKELYEWYDPIPCRLTRMYFSLALPTNTTISKPSVYASGKVNGSSRSTKATQAGTNHSSTPNILAMAILSASLTNDPSLLIPLIDHLRAPSHSYL